MYMNNKESEQIIELKNNFFISYKYFLNYTILIKCKFYYYMWINISHFFLI